MTIRDINNIIAAVCPNDEDYEKPCISPKYLRQELEQLALDQEPKIVPIAEIKYDEDKLKELVNKAVLTVHKSQEKGHWIENAEEYYKAINERGGGVNENTPYFVDDIACSKCLAKFSVIDNEAERFDFCPCCGSNNK